jgi:hypothetical protein
MGLQLIQTLIQIQTLTITITATLTHKQRDADNADLGLNNSDILLSLIQ